jgi:hypothetical protein
MLITADKLYKTSYRNIAVARKHIHKIHGDFWDLKLRHSLRYKFIPIQISDHVWKGKDFVHKIQSSGFYLDKCELSNLDQEHNCHM